MLSDDRTSLNAKLHKAPVRQRSMKISDPLSDRLDDLCKVLNVDGDLPTQIYRMQLLAALIAMAPESAEALEKLFTDYTDLKVRDARLGDDKKSNVIELRTVKPGRRAS